MNNFVNLFKDIGTQTNQSRVRFNEVQWIKTLSMRLGTLEISEG